MTDKKKHEYDGSQQPALPLSWNQVQRREKSVSPDDSEAASRQNFSAENDNGQAEAGSQADPEAGGGEERTDAAASSSDYTGEKPRRHVSLLGQTGYQKQEIAEPGVADDRGMSSAKAEADDAHTGAVLKRQEDGGGKITEEGPGNTEEARPRQGFSAGQESDLTGGGDNAAEAGREYEAVQVPDFDVSLGAFMAQARQKYGQNAEEVSRRTRIPRDFIENLEADRYEKLPPAVYTRSYISQLGREYGIDPEPCLKAYDKLNKPRSDGGGGGSKPMTLVINSDSEDGSTLTYSPRTTDNYLGSDSGWRSSLPRLAVMFATALLVIVVISAVAVQQYRNYRMSRSDTREPVPATGMAEEPEERMEDIEELVPPQQLPLRALPIPE